ncbi:MAG: hypothetical protein H6926_00840 [Chromatiales bacterium]|nr:hypothetical protein [Gammaproteobacteria bacterium]MCP5351725.1 hypothetical protein [Chromatiales bacterium]
MRAFLRRSLLSVRLVSPGLFIFLAVFPLLSSASVVAVNGEGGAYGRVFLNNGGGIADEFGWIGGGAGSPTYNLTPGGTTSFSDNGSATYNDNGPASNVSGSTNLAVTGSSVTGSGSITGNSTFDGTFSTYYFHFGTIVNSVVDLGGPNTAFTLTYTFQDNYAINNGAHVFWYGARAGTAYNSGDILSVNDGGPGLLFMTDGPGSVFITNTISGVTGIDGLLYLRFDVQAAGQWQGYGFDPYSVSSTSSWSFELNVDSPANSAVPIATPFMLMLFGLAGLATRATTNICIGRGSARQAFTVNRSS